MHNFLAMQAMQHYAAMFRLTSTWVCFEIHNWVLEFGTMRCSIWAGLTSPLNCYLESKHHFQNNIYIMLYHNNNNITFNHFSYTCHIPSYTRRHESVLLDFLCAYNFSVSLTVQRCASQRMILDSMDEAFGNCEANEGCWCAEASSISETIQRRWISENPVWHGTLHKSVAGTDRSFAHSWRCFCQNPLEAMWMSLSLNRVCQDWATGAQLLSPHVSRVDQTCEIDFSVEQWTYHNFAQDPSVSTIARNPAGISFQVLVLYP